MHDKGKPLIHSGAGQRSYSVDNKGVHDEVIDPRAASVEEMAGLDTWNYALFSLESIMNIAFIPAVLLLFYICVTQKNLHVNFRVALFLVGVGYLLFDLVRLTNIATRMCCVGLQNPPLMHNLFIFQTVGSSLSIFAWLLLILERSAASIFIGFYEARFSGTLAPIVMFVAVQLLTALLCCITLLQLVNEIYLLGFQFVVVLVSLAAIIAILVRNTTLYRERHNSGIHLANRYQLDENIRVGKYLIPVAVNDTLAKAIYALLVAYSIFYTDIPQGQDTTHLSHAYDLLTAYQRLFFGLALTLRSEKFDHLMNRTKRTASIVGKQAVAASHYFDELKQMW